MKKPADQLFKDTYDSCPHANVKQAFESTYDHVCTQGTSGGSIDMEWSDVNIRYGDNSIVGSTSELLLASLLKN